MDHGETGEGRLITRVAGKELEGNTRVYANIPYAASKMACL
jgi:hypothetical protein